MLTSIVAAMGTVAVALICWMELRSSRPQSPKHTLDCLDFRRQGTTDAYCTAFHGPDWFSAGHDSHSVDCTPAATDVNCLSRAHWSREDVEALNMLDGQIGFKP